MRANEQNIPTFAHDALEIAATFAPVPTGTEVSSVPPCTCGQSSRAVEEGLSHHLERLWRFALVRCGDPAMADDLVQATCLRALEKAQQFEPGTRLDSWLFTILESIWRNTLRSQSVRQGQGIVDVADAHLESEDASEETRIELADTMRAIAELPEGQRAVVLLICAEGFSYSEAASVLDVPVGTVMSRLSTARQRLKKERDRAFLQTQ